MKLELTNPKAWSKISERNIPMESKLKVYEKVGGAYRLGRSGGEQVYNTLSELIKGAIKEYSLPKASIAKKKIVPADIKSKANGLVDSIKSNSNALASAVKGTAGKTSKSADSYRDAYLEEDGDDHEVGMAMNLLDDIIRNANELKGKIGTEEFNMPGWVQDHISQSQNFINQANTGYHELKTK